MGSGRVPDSYIATLDAGKEHQTEDNIRKLVAH